LPASSNHFVRPRQRGWRNRDADLLRCLEINDELELRRLLDRQISGLCAFQDLVDENGGASETLIVILNRSHFYPEGTAPGRSQRFPDVSSGP
jgi:hypothetical protein